MQGAAAAIESMRAGWDYARWTGWFAAWVEAERGRFVPWLSVCMGIGVCAYFAQATEPHPWTGPVAVLAALLATVASWRSMLARAAAFAALAAALGFFSGQAATWRALPIEPLPSRAVILTGTVRGVDILPDGRRATLAEVRLGADAPTLQRLVRVRLRKNDMGDVAAGDEMRVRALLRPPAMPAYPGAWDSQRDAFFGGLAGSGTALNPIEVVERAPPRGFAASVQAARDAVAYRAIAGLPGPAGTIAATLFTGGMTSIAPGDREAFRDSGLAHLLSVSGLHIGIVMGLVMGVARFGLALHERTALHWPNRAVAAILALACGGAYVLFIGAQVPVMRSFAMAFLVTLGLVVGRRALSLRGLALAAAALMAFAPNEVLNVSFQMSFAAVLALVAGYEALRPYLAKLHGPGWSRRTVAHVVALALTSLLAGTASAPYGAYHFGHFQMYYIVANLIAVPLTAFWVMPAGLAALALMPFGWEWLALAPMGWGIEAILWIARSVASWPVATMAVPHMPAWGLAVFSFGLAWLGLWRSRIRLIGLALMLASLLSPVTAPAPDILMSPDARLIALKSKGYWTQSRSGASKFVLEAWQNHLASGPLTPIQTGQPGFCDAETCRLEGAAGAMLMLRNSSRAGDCAGVALLISSEPARGECPPDVPYLDRFSVWRDGAHAIWLRPGGPSSCPTARIAASGPGCRRCRRHGAPCQTCQWRRQTSFRRRPRVNTCGATRPGTPAL